MLAVAGLIWSKRANQAELKAGLMNINDVIRRSTSRILRRHHRVSKPGSGQAEQSRTEKQ